MGKSFRKNPRVWWRYRNPWRMLRAKIKALDPEMDIDHGYYKKLDYDFSECTEWESWERLLAFHKDFDPDMTAVDEWELYQGWLKRIMRK